MELKKLSVFELANVKRTNLSVKSQLKKRDKLQKKIADAQTELDNVISIIEAYEAPIKLLTGGYTSEEVLNGTFEKALMDQQYFRDAVERGDFEGTVFTDDIQLTEQELNVQGFDIENEPQTLAESIESAERAEQFYSQVFQESVSQNIVNNGTVGEQVNVTTSDLPFNV